MTDGDGTDDSDPNTESGVAATPDQAAEESPAIEGLPVEEATERVSEAGEDADPGTIRSALDHVAADGVVTREAVDDALGHLAKVVSTPETRLELAEMELAEAREAADPLAEYDVVAARLDEFEERRDAVAEQVETVTERNRALVERDHETANLWVLAREVELVTRDANAAQRAADELTADIEEFEEWLSDPETRADHLAGDLTALESTLSELEDGTDGVARAVGEDDSTGDGEGESPVGQHADPGLAWFDARVRLAMVDLLVADLHNELDTLREWGEREGVETAPLTDAEDRLATLESRHDDVDERLDELARPEWENRFAQPLAALEGRFDEMEPPVDWAAVQATLEQYRTVVE